ncbi:predicted protein [Sclerotinia sclerotiorum 1980 UF-70]|uniref:Uncharacterized protein n=1 Tax=Sclerotinia sclerotiorum (strain ATCC 18683 / 1980 / Ss-1) TaxID=665079 RepID=A7EPN0_SCLS1|nr:predicted protein [Sclerotinia sclerotiorum 1980 UF-70]EDO04796.1 predicted protein [Sclerotinia sclerotiorum 1980 UF-70]
MAWECDLDLEIRAYGILHVDDNDLEPKCLIGKILHENGSCFSLVSQMRLMFVFTFLNHPGTWVLQARDGVQLSPIPLPGVWDNSILDHSAQCTDSNSSYGYGRYLADRLRAQIEKWAQYSGVSERTLG